MIEALASLSAATTQNKTSMDPAIREKAKEFEAMFLSEMVSHMFEGVETDPMFGGGHGEDMFRSMLTQEYGKKMAEGRGIGLADQIQRLMIELQQKG